jgi:two-component system chemotaxis response regulator CheY
MHILIAEDDNVSRKLLTSTLMAWNHTVHAVTDGEAAWEAWQGQRMRLVVTDWMMPGLDGPELCRRIRAAQGGAEDPAYLVLLTSRDTPQDIAEAFEAGADDFIGKPFHVAELRARLQAGMRILDLQETLIRLKKEQEDLALTDPLTRLLNRRAGQQRLAIDDDRMRREQRPMGVVMVDIDHFKAVNDDHGHSVGDRLLRITAECLEACVRGGDYVARWGGEEFLVALPGADIIQCAEVAERCRNLLASQRFPVLDGQVLQVTASFGAASTEGADRCDAESLIEQADRALYWAKQGGRNRVKIYVRGADDPGQQRQVS